VQIGGESIGNLLRNMVLGKKKLQKDRFKNTLFLCLFTWEWAK
jgi:hypothetical protein